MLLLFNSTPVPLLSSSGLGLELASCEAEERGALTDSSAPPSPPSEGFIDGGRVEEPVGVLACLCAAGEDRKNDPPLVPLLLSLPDCCLFRLPPLLSPPAGE